MSLTWFNDELKEIIVTVTTTQLTINKFGATFFEKANQVMLGYDPVKKIIAIKPLSKNDVMRGDIPEHTRYNVSLSSSYARITNKSFIKKVSDIFNLNPDKEGIKFKAIWKDNTELLEVLINKEE
ncbi:hypothetical protein [Haploplasma modicum]|uniref:hypothetical protein n=1 Tax=Haploplasma modicum TaxID=2150 RepID=UPI00214AE3A6|nr:hypothetical protein [Haploplasma modicum]MCR1808772.1 hypothetical protein [Haploplasma modicum]